MIFECKMWMMVGQKSDDGTVAVPFTVKLPGTAIRDREKKYTDAAGVEHTVIQQVPVLDYDDIEEGLKDLCDCIRQGSDPAQLLRDAVKGIILEARPTTEVHDGLPAQAEEKLLAEGKARAIKGNVEMLMKISNELLGKKLNKAEKTKILGDLWAEFMPEDAV